MVRNKPLARALYELCEIGDIVPEELYRPVAEILAYARGAGLDFVELSDHNTVSQLDFLVGAQEASTDVQTPPRQ
mgnify:CR=1 FL=1